jgi:hypothetical protein
MIVYILGFQRVFDPEMSFLTKILIFQAYDQKNIRRRVYDALNVLMAMNIISKEKKEIKWIGLPTNSAQECQNLEVRYTVLTTPVKFRVIFAPS